MPFAEDLSVFFKAAEFATVATWGAESANVILDSPTEDVLGGRVSSTEYMLTMPATQFAGIGRNATIQIGLSGYLVREVRLIDDGAIKVLLVSKV